MGVLRGLVGLGVAAGAAFAAMKVAQKYDENKAAETEAFDEAQEPVDFVQLEQPEQAQEPQAEENAAGGVVKDIVRAVGDVLIDAGAKVKAAAQKAGVDTDELKDALQGAGNAVAHAGGAVVDYVKQETPGVVENVREGARDVLAHVKDAVSVVSFGPEEDEDDAVDEDSAVDTWDVVYNNAQDEADAAQKAADAAQEAADAAQEAADAAQEVADAAQEAADALYDEEEDDEDDEDEDDDLI